MGTPGLSMGSRLSDNKLGKNVNMRTKRNEFIWQLGQLAARMESNESNKNVVLVGSKSNNDQFDLTQYKIQAGKIIVEAYQSGEFRGHGTLCRILDFWRESSSSGATDWDYIQSFESICWQWYGNRFDDRRKELGELNAYAYIIRLLASELEKENID